MKKNKKTSETSTKITKKPQEGTIKQQKGGTTLKEINENLTKRVQELEAEVKAAKEEMINHKNQVKDLEKILKHEIGRKVELIDKMDFLEKLVDCISDQRDDALNEAAKLEASCIRLKKGLESMKEKSECETSDCSCHEAEDGKKVVKKVLEGEEAKKFMAFMSENFK